MTLKGIPSLNGIADKHVLRVLSAIVQVIQVRFFGKAGRPEQVVLQKDITSFINSGIEGEIRVLSDARITNSILEKKQMALTIKQGRIVGISEKDWA